MKILLVSTGSGSQGGGEYYLLVLAEALSAKGHEVHLALPDHPRMQAMRSRGLKVATLHDVNSVNTYDRKFRLFGALADRKAIQRYEVLFSRIEPDIIHVNQQVLEDGLDVIIAVQHSGRPVVVTTHVTHGAHALGAKVGWLRDRMAERVMSRLQCSFIVVSSASREVLRQRLYGHHDVPHDCIDVVYNGVECSVPFNQEDRLAIRSGWSVEGDTPVIGIVGRIEAQKNPLFLVGILQALKQLQLQFKAVWVGDGRMNEALRAAIHEAGLDNQFHLDGWREDVPIRLRAMDLFVLPSAFEGLPFALQEAMCAALPVCVAAVDGMSEVVEDGTTGFLCRSGDHAHWVSRITELLTDREQRAKLGQQARHFGERHFSTARMAEDTVRVYRQAKIAFDSRQR